MKTTFILSFNLMNSVTAGDTNLRNVLPSSLDKNLLKDITTNESPTDILQCTSGKRAQTTKCMTREEYDEIANKVVDLYKSLTFTEGSDLAGCLVRFTGHDVMDYNPNPQPIPDTHLWTWGGNDGCVNFQDPDNKGLKDCIIGENGHASIKDIYSHYCTTVSFADFMNIAAESLIAHTSSDKNGMRERFRNQFKFGRTTADYCLWNNHLPNPEKSCIDVEDNFVKRLGLDWREAATLMGAHTLGRARAENSGYVGWWSDRENSGKFNNNYYTSMLLKGWIPQNNPSGSNDQKNQWMRSDKGGNSTRPKKPWDGVNNEHQEMMLNTDMCLVYQPADADFVEPDHSLHLFSNSTGLTGGSCCAWVEAEHLLLPDHIADLGCNDVEDCGCDDHSIDPRPEENKIRWDLPATHGIKVPEEERKLTGSDDGKPKRLPDCYNFEIPQGPPSNDKDRVSGWGAANAVIDFTRDEELFYKEFLEVWYKVTTKGYDTTLYSGYDYQGRGGLKPLQEDGRCYFNLPPKTPSEKVYLYLMIVFIIISLALGIYIWNIRKHPPTPPENEYSDKKPDAPTDNKQEYVDKPVSSSNVENALS